MPMVSLQISEEMMNSFDTIQKKLGFTSRSEALRESILFFIQEHQQEIPNEGHQIAIITLNHILREDILDKFSEITQKYENIIKSVTQYNLKEHVVKTITVAGNGDEINDLYKDLMTQNAFKVTITKVIIPTGE